MKNSLLKWKIIRYKLSCCGLQLNFPKFRESVDDSFIFGGDLHRTEQPIKRTIMAGFA